MTHPYKLCVIGAGSWGTALAIQFARAGCSVSLWGRDRSTLEQLVHERVNRRYLPDAPFPPTLTAQVDWKAALNEADGVLVSVPSHAFRGVLEQLAVEPSLEPDFALCWATKGLELTSLSGPTFATEVGRGLPTAITIAASEAEFADELANRISSPGFRAYTSVDIVGVEVGGAVKNVLAIAAGLSDGLGFGANARVALINRGLREMTRLGVAMGAEAQTFAGLAGMGDLVLTCTDNQSRNRRMGLALAAGQSIADAQAEMGQVVEGVTAAKAVHQQAIRLGVDMPIIEQVYRMVYEGISADEAVKVLMSRATGAEID